LQKIPQRLAGVHVVAKECLVPILAIHQLLEGKCSPQAIPQGVIQVDIQVDLIFGGQPCLYTRTEFMAAHCTYVGKLATKSFL